MYRHAAGQVPPREARVPAAVRMSTSTVAMFDLIRRDTVGSVVTAASIRSCCIAAISVFPAPTGIGVYSPWLPPPLVTRNAASQFVQDPSPGTPLRLPLMPAG